MYDIGFLSKASGEIVAKSHTISASGQFPSSNQFRFNGGSASTLTFLTSAFEEDSIGDRTMQQTSGPPLACV